MMDPDKLRRLKFSEAAPCWLETRKPYLRPRTIDGLTLHISQLAKFFGELPLHKIHIAHIRDYQAARAENRSGLWTRRCGASIIRHELSTLQSILRRAGEWSKIKDFYEPPKLPRRSKPKVLSDRQEMEVFIIASRSPELEVAYWAGSITCNSGASGTELRHVQLEDLYLDQRTPGFYVKSETAKCEERGRFVVLNPTALKQMQRCMERAQKLGSSRPEHYLFPRRTAPGKFDPAQPASESWLRRGFDKLREATGIEWLTPHCFRHQHITLRVEAGEPLELVSKDVGHASIRMTREYLHLRGNVRSAGVNAIDPTVRFGPRASTEATAKGSRAKRPGSPVESE